jgi:hypothetical protein
MVVKGDADLALFGTIIEVPRSGESQREEQGMKRAGNRRRGRCGTLVIALSTFLSGSLYADVPTWVGRKAVSRLVLPEKDAHGSRLVASTINGYLGRSYGIELPVARSVEKLGTYFVAGVPGTNVALRDLVRKGLRLTDRDIGEEGFQLLTHEEAGARFIIIYGKTPRALKQGCQELLFFQMPATVNGGSVEWPLNIVKKPDLSYRGTYMLPCWAAHDSFASWERVLRFNSELTINRNWFWLDGFPVADHTGEYGGTDLANPQNVQRLLDLAAEEDMKILIGGGWFNWHHEKAVGKDLQKGIDYYLNYLSSFKNFHGFYFEPTGEGGETDRWRDESEALSRLIETVLDKRPAFEIALAIGKFNNTAYQQRMARFDPKRVFWWWCWGDPIRDKALDRYPSVLRWHVIMRMSGYHGSMAPPSSYDRPLAGIVTSYDPGQGFGNPWNGWGKLGVSKPRNFHPHTIPYFAHQYFYRERCWNLEIEEREVIRRIGRRLFDADAPAGAAGHYWWLSKHALLASQNQRPTMEQLTGIRRFLDALRGRAWTARMRDTVRRMEEALGQLSRLANPEE